jgi:hypothetical protein
MEEKKEKEFCVLCGKYTEDELKLVVVGVINFVRPPQMMRIPVGVSCCSKCVTVMMNANRIYRETKKKFQEEISKPAGQGNIVIPELKLPDDFLKKLKS